jgi:1-hydroxycarotenoid 3,4-desaturase
MTDMTTHEPPIIVIGAGIGGLASALRLSAAGRKVLVLERHAHAGGKMRTVPSSAGPIDAGPTVMTMRPVFEDLFRAAGTRLSDHVELEQQHILARHFWSDGSSLNLFSDHNKSQQAIATLSGKKDAQAFAQFSADAKRLFDAFEAPMMHAAKPSQAALIKQVARDPGLFRAMDPLRSLAGSLARKFNDPRLRQLFGRYATYVGGDPSHAPALLSLIWHAEASGVWAIKGGMQKLARALANLIEDQGGEIIYGTGVGDIIFERGQISGVRTDDGQVIATNQVIFNGDPRALSLGLLGSDATAAVPTSAVEPRSLSAYVWSFAATPKGRDLVHHNVFFADTPEAEFDAISKGQVPQDATLYLCAQDRNDSATAPQKQERFEIIMNGAPIGADPSKEEFETCRTQTFNRLGAMGLSFDEMPTEQALTTPKSFEALFPGSAGSLYGRSPHGLTAGLKRPTARTTLKGLYLAGGGAHPGAGIPMAALSGKHAAEAILTDLASTSTSPKTATRGGMSTASPTTARARSRSSVS